MYKNIRLSGVDMGANPLSPLRLFFLPEIKKNHNERRGQFIEVNLNFDEFQIYHLGEFKFQPNLTIM